MTAFRHIGSVSSGTMREEDLIPAFMDVLDSIWNDIATSAPKDFEGTEWAKRQSAKITDVLASVEQNRSSYATEEDYYSSEDAHYDLNETLWNLLDSFAPAYCYFGAHEGDGLDYGFWPSQDAITDAIHDGDLLEVSDLSDVPDNHTGDVIHVNDHGNMTLYTCNGGKLSEVWSIV